MDCSKFVALRSLSSIPAKHCELGVSFGCWPGATDRMWVASGCRASFTCGGVGTGLCPQSRSLNFDRLQLNCSCDSNATRRSMLSAQWQHQAVEAAKRDGANLQSISSAVAGSDRPKRATRILPAAAPRTMSERLQDGDWLHDTTASARTETSSRCLIFYHVPKAAGSALGDWLRKRGLRAFAFYHPLPDPLPPTLPGLHSADVIMGHFSPVDAPRALVPPFSPQQQHARIRSLRAFLGRYNFTRRCHEWTILREPLARVTSALFYQNEHALTGRPLEGGSLETILDCLATHGKRGERLSRFGGGPCGARSPNSISRHPSGRKADYVNDMCRRFGRPPHWNSYEDAYEYANRSAACDAGAALETFRSLDGIGFTHALNASLEIWHAIFFGANRSGASRSARQHAASAKQQDARHETARPGSIASGSIASSSSLKSVNWRNRPQFNQLPERLQKAIRDGNEGDAQLYRRVITPCEHACAVAFGNRSAGNLCAAIVPSDRAHPFRCVVTDVEPD